MTSFLILKGITCRHATLLPSMPTSLLLRLTLLLRLPNCLPIGTQAPSSVFRANCFVKDPAYAVGQSWVPEAGCGGSEKGSMLDVDALGDAVV
jgi:hypothetical protein